MNVIWVSSKQILIHISLAYRLNQDPRVMTLSFLIFLCKPSCFGPKHTVPHTLHRSSLDGHAWCCRVHWMALYLMLNCKDVLFYSMTLIMRPRSCHLTCRRTLPRPIFYNKLINIINHFVHVQSISLPHWLTMERGELWSINTWE